MNFRLFSACVEQDFNMARKMLELKADPDGHRDNEVSGTVSRDVSVMSRCCFGVVSGRKIPVVAWVQPCLWLWVAAVVTVTDWDWDCDCDVL